MSAWKVSCAAGAKSSFHPRCFVADRSKRAIRLWAAASSFVVVLVRVLVFSRPFAAGTRTTRRMNRGQALMSGGRHSDVPAQSVGGFGIHPSDQGEKIEQRWAV